MKAVIAIAALLLGAAAFLASRRRRYVATYFDAIPVNKQFWLERNKENGELLYAAIGDSAAQGIGASSPDRSYVGLLAEHMGAATGRTVRVANLGISGGTVSTAIRSELPRFSKLEPDVVTVCIGANDVLAFDAVRFEKEIRQLFAALPAHAIVADLPSFHFLPLERTAKRAGRIIRTIAGEHGFTMVDLHATTRRVGLRGVATQFAGDLFHPNDAGYRVWASAFTAAVDARLAQIA